MSTSVTQLRNGTTFIYRNHIHQVLKYEHIKMGRGGAVIRLRLRNLETRAVFEQTFKNNESVDEAATARRVAQFLYREATNLWFMDPKNFEQFAVDRGRFGEAADFLTEGKEVALIVRADDPQYILALDLPAKVELTVIETAPEVKGSTVSRVTKPATLEGGVIVQVPGFVKEGDRIRVNTETREYVERA